MAERSVKLNSLKILLHIYQNKWINSKLNPIFHYETKHAAVWPILKDQKQELISKREQQAASQRGQNAKVACVVELKATFENFKQVVDMKTKQHKELYEPIVDLILVYSQSNYKMSSCCIEFVMPIFMSILDGLKEQGKDDLMVGQAPLPLTLLLSKMVESLIYFLSVDGDRKSILIEQDKICHLLLKLVQNEDVFRGHAQLLFSLEHLIKIIFHYKGAKLSKTYGLDFVKFMLKGGVEKSSEFKTLGVFTLYCIALGLQEDKKICNIDFFHDGDVLNQLMLYVKDKQSKD